MNKIKLIGLDFKSAIQHTKNCLTVTLSPVKKDAVARSFLKRFLRANNEHSLSQHFINENSKNQYVICFNELEGSKIETQTFTITSSEILEDDLKSLFRARFYLDDYIIEEILNSDLIEFFIAENDLDVNIIHDQIKQMNKESLIDWFFDNFELHQLIHDSFFCEVLQSGSAAIVVCMTYPSNNVISTSYDPNAED